ncbi:unnamed protein product [Rangifer tarandus platyrhynchus]|uniref:Uncharacterized protein n=1 Tax=Rangifer tarandus platyrhynchus TaxID=3082113 RepID=A0AC60A7X5_RANTA
MKFPTEKGSCLFSCQVDSTKPSPSLSAQTPGSGLIQFIGHTESVLKRPTSPSTLGSPLPQAPGMPLPHLPASSGAHSPHRALEGSRNSVWKESWKLKQRESLQSPA